MMENFILVAFIVFFPYMIYRYGDPEELK